jgi:hypothetical protein
VPMNRWSRLTITRDLIYPQRFTGLYECRDSPLRSVRASSHQQLFRGLQMRTNSERGTPARRTVLSYVLYHIAPAEEKHRRKLSPSTSTVNYSHDIAKKWSEKSVISANARHFSDDRLRVDYPRSGGVLSVTFIRSLFLWRGKGLRFVGGKADRNEVGSTSPIQRDELTRMTAFV